MREVSAGTYSRLFVSDIQTALTGVAITHSNPSVDRDTMDGLHAVFFPSLV